MSSRRLAIIEARLQEKGWAEYKLRKRDYAAPIAAIGVVGMVMPAADALVGHFAGHAATHCASTMHVATSAAAHHGADAASVVGHHPEVFMKAVEHGAQAQVSELTKGAVGHAASVVPVGDLAVQNANAVGYAAGEVLMKTAELKSTSFAVKRLTEMGSRVLALLGNRCTKRRSVILVPDAPPPPLSAHSPKKKRKNAGPPFSLPERTATLMTTFWI